jgi:SAM-dependent methyltransferase
MMNPAEFANIVRTEQTFWWFAGMQRILFRLLDHYWGDAPPGRVLEVGAGTGYFASQLERRYGCQVDVSDFLGEGLAYARERGARHLLRADVRALPVRGGAYDAVFALDVLVHLERGQEAGAFGELCRAARPGGWLVVRVSALDILRSRHSAFTQERQRFTRPRLLELARSHGLQVVRCTYLNSLLMPVALAKFRIWEPLRSAPPSSGLEPVPRWLNTLLGAALRAECAWLGRGGNFPAGQSLLLIARQPAQQLQAREKYQREAGGEARFSGVLTRDDSLAHRVQYDFGRVVQPELLHHVGAVRLNRVGA